MTFRKIRPARYVNLVKSGQIDQPKMVLLRLSGAGLSSAMFKRCNDAGGLSGGNAAGRGGFSRISALLLAHLALLNRASGARKDNLEKGFGTVGMLCMFVFASPVSGVDTPRTEYSGDLPAYEVVCPEGAADAQQCQVDLLTYTGWRTYKIECQQCHGGGGMGSTFAPNLMDRINREGVDYGRFLYVMDNGYTGRMGVMPSLLKDPRVQKNKAALFAYLKARADDMMPNGRPPKPE